MPVKNTVFALARLDEWPTSVIHLLREKSCRGGQRWNEYSDASGQFLRSASTQLVSAIRQLAKYWRSEEFEADTHSFFLKTRHEFDFVTYCSATRIVSLPSLSKTYTAMDPHWFQTIVFSKLGRIHICCVAELTSDFKSVIRPESNEPYSFFSPAVIDRFIQ